jgi:predicted nucleic acid-binding protein
MVLADTSVWIAHFREGQSLLSPICFPTVSSLHPFVAGELACGTLNKRKSVFVRIGCASALDACV